MDRTRYLVCHRHGAFEYMPPMREALLDAIWAGEFFEVHEIFAFNPVEHICDDITEDIAAEFDHRRPLREHTPAHDFVEEHRGVRAAREITVSA